MADNLPTSCPRCGLEVGHPSYESIQVQIANCPFCRENSRRIGTKQHTLAVPTEEFPTWQTNLT